MRSPTNPSRLSAVSFLWTAALAAGVGCQAPRGPVSIHSDDPDLKIQAMKRDAAERNPTDNPTLVRDLDSDDAAIRFYAVNTLRQVTGDDFGYRFYDDADVRKPAVARWRAWLAKQGSAAGGGAGTASGN